MFRILYAGHGDKDPRILENLVRETGGIRGDTAGSAREALMLLARNPYDIVVSDIRLPDMDSPDFLRNVQKSCPGLPVLFCSGQVNPTGKNIQPGQGSTDDRDTFPESIARDAARNIGRSREVADYRRFLDTIRESVLVISDGNVVFANNSFNRTFAGPVEGEIEGYPVPEFIYAMDTGESIGRMMEMTREGDFSRESLVRIPDPSGDTRLFSCLVTTTVWSEKPALLFCLMDVTAATDSEVALAHANRKIRLLGDLTRHDITNRLTVLRARLKRARNASRDPQVLSDLEEAEYAGQDIFRYLDTARMYQDRGIIFPQWFLLQSILDSSRSTAECRNLSISFESVNVEIFADPLCPRVFENLFENSLRHGKSVSEICVSTRETDNGLVISLADNGCGIAEGEKESVFLQGVGRNTGLGLFLSREILSITGITIRETGTFGYGARFEITVPRGAYRPSSSAPAVVQPCSLKN